jgi:antitoxin HicB
MTKKTKGHIGSSFDDFLKENGLYEEVTARAIQRVIARQQQHIARMSAAKSGSSD